MGMTNKMFELVTVFFFIPMAPSIRPDEAAVQVKGALTSPVRHVLHHMHTPLIASSYENNKKGLIVDSIGRYQVRIEVI